MSKIYVQFIGGLGNQMFEYAFYKKLQKLGNNVYANLSYYRYDGVMPFVLEDTFKNIIVKKVFEKKGFWVDVRKRMTMEFSRIFEEKQFGTYDEKLLEKLSKKNHFIEGYWQTEEYFKDIREELISDFEFSITDESLRSVLDEMNTCQSVSVHIRRGDYLKADKIYGNICTLDYYKNAMHYVADKVGALTYYIFSDDIEWAKKNLPDIQPSQGELIFIEKEQFNDYHDWYDMAMMSHCKHNIIANSSFSWWGAWLNRNDEKMVIAPSRWLNTEDAPDIWCDGWIKING